MTIQDDVKRYVELDKTCSQYFWDSAPDMLRTILEMQAENEKYEELLQKYMKLVFIAKDGI